MVRNMKTIVLILFCLGLVGCSKPAWTTEYTGHRGYTEEEVDEGCEYFNIQREDSWTKVVIAIMKRMKENENNNYN